MQKYIRKKKWNIFTIGFICFDYCIYRYSDCSGPQVALVYMIWKWNKLCVAMELLHVYEHLVQPATQLCSKRAWQIMKKKNNKIKCTMSCIWKKKGFKTICWRIQLCMLVDFSCSAKPRSVLNSLFFISF